MSESLLVKFSISFSVMLSVQFPVCGFAAIQIFLKATLMEPSLDGIFNQ